MFRSGGAASTSSGGANSNGGHALTADELEVSEILLSLPRLIYSNVRWGSKKKRSTIKSHPSPIRRLLRPSPAPGSPKRKDKSPTSTLDFPVESDVKIFKEMNRVGDQQKQLLADNQALRAKRLELLGLLFNVRFPELETPEEISPKNSGSSSSDEEEVVTRLGSSTTLLFPCPISQVAPFVPSAVGSHRSNSVGPVGFPGGLNLFAHVPSQPLDRVFDIRHYRDTAA